jgi:lysophospholipase L1-like esterase
VVNAGRSGDTTFEAIARLNHEVIALQPRLVIITIGGNDILNKIPSETVAANLAAIVMPLHAAGAMVAFVDISPPAGGWTMKFLKRQNREMGVLNLEGIMDDIWKNPELMSDSVHPNDKGYALIAERIAEKIMPHLTTIKNP